jgi:ketosteroid isomerase-like protein
MNNKRSPREVFLALVHGICEGRIDDVLALYAEKTNVSHPFDPLRGHGLASRAQLAEHFSRRPVRQTIKVRPANIKIHETLDPEVIVAEFDYAGENLENGKRFSYRCIFVMRVRDGEIVESRDYVDHLGSAEARGQLGPVLTDVMTRRVATGPPPTI